MPQLVIHSKEEDWEIELGKSTTIGRVLANDICLHDPNASRYHSEITETEHGYVYKDLNSSNGSYVKDVRITKKFLSNGDVIRVGKTTLTFIEDHLDTTPAGLVRIASIPISNKAIQERIKIGEENAFTPAHLIADGMDWRGDYEKLRLGNEMFQYVGIKRDLNNIINNIAGKLLDIFPADRCAILLLDSETDKLIPVTIKVMTGIQKHMSISDSILREVQKTCSSLFIADVSSDERFSGSESILVQGLHSILCAPIIYGDNFYGVIHLDSQKSAMVFTRKDLQLITSLSSHVATVVANTRLLRSVEQEAKDKAQLERLLPPSVIQKIAKGEIKLEKKGGENKEATILFADIRGFTHMSHKAPATDVVEMLNEYFELIVNIVFQYGGTVDKFIGDEVMVLFDAITDVEFPEDRAVRCAFHMHGALKLFNKERKQQGKKAIEIGIGINTGEVVVGVIGSNQAMQYTCIGDAVNIASRLTGVAGANQTIISASTYHKMKVKPKYEQLPPCELKGIESPIQLYSVWEQVTDTTIHDIQ